MKETDAKKVKRTFLIITALVAVAVLSFFLLSRSNKKQLPEKVSAETTHEEGHDEHSQEGTIEVSEEIAGLIGIKTEPVARGEIEDTISTTGKVFVTPNGQAIIGAKVSGRAVRVLVEPGDHVGAGQAVAIIDSPQIAEMRGQLIEARSRLRLAEQNKTRVRRDENKAAVIQAKNRLDLATATLNRKQKLAELGAAPGREVLEAETEYKNAKAEYDYQSSIQINKEQQQTESEVEQAKATVARLTQSLASLGASNNGSGGTISIQSPIAGTVTDRHISAGETVTEDKELLTVMNLSTVIVEAQLPESQANRVRVGQRLVAQIPSMPGQSFEGVIYSVGDTVNREKRTIGVRARITNKGMVLKHEMAVDVKIASGGRKDALLVPVSALVDDEGLKVVYVKEGDKYEKRTITLGAITYQLAEVLSGVEGGENVVIAGAYQLRNMKKGGAEEGGDHDEH